jgi:hypothetical protein
MYTLIYFKRTLDLRRKHVHSETGESFLTSKQEFDVYTLEINIFKNTKYLYFFLIIKRLKLHFQLRYNTFKPK